MVGVDNQAPGKQPGLLFVNSKITKPDQLSPQQYTAWYARHIEDIFKTSGFKEAARWEALDPTQDRPYLALYPLEDLNFLNSDEFKAIPVHDDQLPGSGAVFEYADFDTRYYAFEQWYEPEKTKSDQPDFVIACGFTPSDDAEYDDWYRTQHLREVSEITGWRKTGRYTLTYARQNRKPAGDSDIAAPPKFLTLHYFDGASLPERELAKSGEEPRAKKNMAAMKETQIAVFKKLSQFMK
ncbi:hypothetical protein B0A48_16151 [Cryoendolithus antarcticus]|uniref:EthD domain-containing protein n=1 Tax=Cryoendolithus antarcticus TaxID=1507870 RepID=A0A1V8SG69_9PEZI|nr:hypothetical protein B0A48_16151 [Cryoendolithus antarcticus]